MHCQDRRTLLWGLAALVVLPFLPGAAPARGPEASPEDRPRISLPGRSERRHG